MAEHRGNFQQLQRAFTAHIRDPDHQPVPPGISAERLAIYRELMFNNIESFMATSFPVVKAVLDSQHWHALVRDFFARHRSRTPFFIEIAEEFLDFLATERRCDADPPFLLELAHYEWVELALATSEAESVGAAGPVPGALLSRRFVLSATAWPLVYRFPVHRICPSFAPETPPTTPTHLLVYRDVEERVKFLEINPVTRRWLELLEDAPELTAGEQLRRLAGELGASEPASLLAFGVELIADFLARGILRLVDDPAPPPFG